MNDEPKTLADWEAMHKPIAMKMVVGGNNPANLDEADAVVFKAGRKGMAIFDPAYVKWLVENSNVGLLDEYHKKPRKPDKELALDAVCRIYGNTAYTLEDVKDNLEEIRDFAEELISAIKVDIEMQSE